VSLVKSETLRVPGTTYRVDKKKTCPNLNFNISKTLHYIWSKFRTLVLNDVIFRPCKLYGCRFTNIPTASKNKTRRQKLQCRNDVFCRPTICNCYASVNVNLVYPWSGGRHQVDTWQKSGRPELDTYSPIQGFKSIRQVFTVFLTNIPPCLSLFLLDMMKISPGKPFSIRHDENLARYSTPIIFLNDRNSTF
jgi:hypothetical protein